MKDSPVIITSKSNFNGVVLVQMFRFRNGLEVPMYEVSTISGFNQLIGYSKFVNRDYGEVYYSNTSVKIYRTKKLNNGSRVTGSAI